LVRKGISKKFPGTFDVYPLLMYPCMRTRVIEVYDRRKRKERERERERCVEVDLGID